MVTFMDRPLYAGKKPRHPLIKGCVCPRAGLDVSERRKNAGLTNKSYSFKLHKNISFQKLEVFKIRCVQGHANAEQTTRHALSALVFVTNKKGMKAAAIVSKHFTSSPKYLELLGIISSVESTGNTTQYT